MKHSPRICRSSLYVSLRMVDVHCFTCMNTNNNRQYHFILFIKTTNGVGEVLTWSLGSTVADLPNMPILIDGWNNRGDVQTWLCVWDFGAVHVRPAVVIAVTISSHQKWQRVQELSCNFDLLSCTDKGKHITNRLSVFTVAVTKHLFYCYDIAVIRPQVSITEINND